MKTKMINLTNEQIISLIDQAKENKEEILKILINELKEVKLSEKSIIFYCSCGYPLSYKYGEDLVWLAEILKKEVDFRSYKEFYYCPKCDRLLAEFQH
jgi:hypothetical protein